MHPLDKKMWRDLWRLRTQVIAVALVIGSGVGLMVMSLSAQEALRTTTEAYYERYRFANVFAQLKRAPQSLAERIADIPGVQTVETRIVEAALLDIDGFEEPVMSIINSVPENRQPVLNQLVLREGRFVALNAPDEVIVNEPFAEAHGLALNDTFRAIINGKKRTLTVVGIALSPEYAYAIAPDALIPDHLRFGILWMGEDALAAAFDLKEAFNNVSLTLLPGTAAEDVIDRLDQLLEPYGGSFAVARKDQISNWFLMSELDQLASMAVILPTVFLSVAAFLTNMVISRLIATERSTIGLFKACGYSNVEIVFHYTKIVVAITMVGVLVGWAVGAALGHYNTAVYADHFSMPFLIFRPSPASFAIGAIASLAAALAGAALAVRAAISLAPAEAMRPPSPPVFSKGAFSRLGFVTGLDQPTRMIFRHTLRWPGRSLVTSFGVGMSVAVVVSALQWLDAIDHMIDSYYVAGQRQDVSIGLTEVRSSTVLAEFRHMPGVEAVEPERNLSAIMRSEHREKRVGLNSRIEHPHLNLIYDVEGGEVPLVGDGLTLSTKLADILNVGVGDTVTVEVLEDRRPIVDMKVTGLFETYLGFPAYARIETLNRIMRERPAVDTVHISLDSRETPRFFRELKDTPGVSGILVVQAAVDNFNETVAQTILIFIGFFSAFAAALCIGVVYNSARIALSERARELATLRVLGFTRFEISYILLGQSALLVALALPIGCAAGWLLALTITTAFDTELYRIPLIVSPASYGVAMVVAIAAAFLSALLVNRKLGRLDLIAVLKTRE